MAGHRGDVRGGVQFPHGVPQVRSSLPNLSILFVRSGPSCGTMAGSHQSTMDPGWLAAINANIVQVLVQRALHKALRHLVAETAFLRLSASALPYSTVQRWWQALLAAWGWA
jgi:hypothetical protein